jgi:hypothetical protein
MKTLRHLTKVGRDGGYTSGQNSPHTHPVPGKKIRASPMPMNSGRKGEGKMMASEGRMT